MQPNPLYKLGVADVRELITRNPWMQLISHPASGPVASPSPVLLAPQDAAVAAGAATDAAVHTSDDGASAEPIVLETHLGRADGRLHGLLQPRDDGEPHRMLVLVQGAHGYISPSWYLGDDAGQIPTWNFEQATLTCDVEVLDAQANMETLQRLVEHFEQAYAPEDGVRLDIDDDGNRGMAMGTIGLRLTVRSFDAKSKMSQNKSDATHASVLAHVEPSNPALATRMRQTGSAEAGSTDAGSAATGSPAAAWHEVTAD
jgi:transcriptional regulator